ncbi:hypothetical protein CEXT_132051 [Caerostris extrusa]|uniref:Uncharacterized protein n=1 Tax=Caerostris extrusa TaxID=172846 RepID=A0AAV4Y4S0_CAEEX|nr:hypothetical protein CEXT_132051 [Caerostris extrusa]
MEVLPDIFYVHKNYCWHPTSAEEWPWGFLNLDERLQFQLRNGMRFFDGCRKILLLFFLFGFCWDLFVMMVVEGYPVSQTGNRRLILCVSIMGLNSIFS